jgi:hypothetical protein
VPQAPRSGALGIIGVSLLASLLAGGCQPVGPLQGAGVTLSVPEGWKPVEPTRWMVPGRALAAWGGPEGSSFVVYRGLPAPRVTAEQLAVGLSTRLTNLPGLRILERESLTLPGAPAIRLDLVAPGFGDALAPSGTGTPVSLDGKTLIPTRQATVLVARAAGPLYFAWHAPESAWPRIAPQIDAMLAGLALSADSQLSSSSY